MRLIQEDSVLCRINFKEDDWKGIEGNFFSELDDANIQIIASGFNKF